MTDMTRQEHMDWCKSRALEYLSPGEFYSLNSAVASMMSDLGKHSETAASANPTLGMIGMMAVANSDEQGVRRFIEGFN